MKKKQIIRIVVDFCMTVLLFLLMSYALIGEAAHEWIGCFMFLLFILHHCLNFSWYKNLCKGKYNGLRVLNTVLDVLLLVSMILQAISGVMMSRYVFSFLSINIGMSFARTTHLLCSYWGFILMSLHIGVHWSRILGVLDNIFHIKKTIAVRKIILRILATILAIYGIYAFFQRQIGSYLFLQNQFVFFDWSESRVAFFADYFAITVLFANIGYYTTKLFYSKRKDGNEQ